MKASALKKMIKDSVREVIQEELKEILLEAVKAPRQTVVESKIGTYTPPFQEPQLHSNPPPEKTQLELKQSYMDVLGETALNFTSQDVPKFNPQGSIDTTSPGGQLPDGEVGMDQIMNLLK